MEKPYPLNIGVSKRNIKQHKFDLGNENYLVECKLHTWTSGNKVPSAKLTALNEAMYYFLLTPKDYKKILFILKDFNIQRKTTLAEYYIKTYKHLIPDDVALWEYDKIKKEVNILIDFL